LKRTAKVAIAVLGIRIGLLVLKGVGAVRVKRWAE
jgi:hypothetical protein